MGSQCLERFLPEFVFGFVDEAKPQSQLVNRVIGTQERLYLGNCTPAIFKSAECNPGGEHVTFGRHKCKRFVVSVNDHHASRKAQWPADSQVDHVYFAWHDRSQCVVEPSAFRPERRKIRFPDRDDFLRRLLRTTQAHTVRLLPHLAESLQWPDDVPPLDI